VEVQDSSGRPLALPPQPPGFGFFEPGQLAPSTNQASVSLPAPSQRGGTLKLVKGFLSADAEVERRELVAVNELSQAEGKTFAGPGGARLTVQRVQRQYGYIQIGVALTGGPGWSYDPNVHRFELTDTQGRPCREPPYSSLTPIPRREACPGDVALLAACPPGGLPAVLPWPALADHIRDQAGPRWVGGQVQFVAEGPAGPPAKLVFYSFRRVRAEVPFELHDVPLP
jgi:hypothetical protein